MKSFRQVIVLKRKIALNQTKKKNILLKDIQSERIRASSNILDLNKDAS
jgi:hypothetical protein